MLKEYIMIIRKPTRQDIPALLDIYNHEVENGVATLDLNKKTLKDWEKWYDNHNIGNHPLIVAEINGEIAGYSTLSAYRAKEAYKSTVELSVYVSLKHRKMGVGAALMKEILRLAREDSSIHTVVSVITSGNKASQKLHKKFGFEFCGTIKEVGVKFGKFLDIENYSLRV